jgi:uncharacterized protein YyaL (SSP411 family)
VMEEESFDATETAEYLNQHFIAIKVDREARPDVDAVYMAAVHAMKQRGGWPLNVWVTPEREPFFAGTYFPPRSRGGRPSFREVLENISAQYRDNRSQLAATAKRIEGQIRNSLGSRDPSESRAPTQAILAAASQRTASFVDRKWGGAQRGIKFPSTLPLRFMLRHAHRTGETEGLELAVLTLEKMAAGGIHDHIGGGFHRYATDPRWLVPHFEKMLYDNALLVVAYLEAGQLTGRKDFTRVARSTLDYLEREMLSPEGVFYSATDADSPSPSGEREEGWFFTWTPAEIESALPPELARAMIAYYGVTASGSYEGRNVLHAWRTSEAVASELEVSPSELERRLADARDRLYRIRSQRPPPLRDDKVLVAWNGLAISAFARAGLTLGDDGYTQVATRAAGFLLDRALGPDGRLRRIYQAGKVSGPAFLEDYAFLIAGLLDLYEAISDPRWLRAAIALQAALDAHYGDEVAGGYFQTADDQEHLIVREKPTLDGAVPSGNSVAALNLLRLAEFTGDYAYEDQAARLFSALSPQLDHHPSAISDLLLAVDFLLSDRIELILIRPESEAGTANMLSVVRADFLPNRVFSSVREDAGLAAHAVVNPLLAEREAFDGRTTAYLCKNRNCNFPTNDPAVLRKQLDALRKPR